MLTSEVMFELGLRRDRSFDGLIGRKVKVKQKRKESKLTKTSFIQKGN